MFGSVQSTAIAACIVPSYPVLMTIPTDPYFDNFEVLTSESISGRSFGLYYHGMLYGAGAGNSMYVKKKLFLDRSCVIDLSLDTQVISLSNSAPVFRYAYLMINSSSQT